MIYHIRMLKNAVLDCDTIRNTILFHILLYFGHSHKSRQQLVGRLTIFQINLLTEYYSNFCFVIMSNNHENDAKKFEINSEEELHALVKNTKDLPLGNSSFLIRANQKCRTVSNSSQFVCKLSGVRPIGHTDFVGHTL